MAPFLYASTSPNINRFSKLFCAQNQEKICNNTITKDPAASQVCRYTLPCEMGLVCAGFGQSHAGPFCPFYSASALLAMQRAVLGGFRLSVRLSVTFRYCVQTNEDMIVRFSASGSCLLYTSDAADE